MIDIMFQILRSPYALPGGGCIEALIISEIALNNVSRALDSNFRNTFVSLTCVSNSRWPLDNDP